MSRSNRDAPIKLTLVVPVYNEEETVAEFVSVIERIFASTPDVAVGYVFINDGSTDSTLARLIALQNKTPGLRILDFSRNFGKEAALTAGLQGADGDVIVPIDVDLQDPPELIPQMIAKWRDGYDVVLARRTDRQVDSLPKRVSSRWFYTIHNKIADHEIPPDVGDFRLMDRKVVEALNTLPESRRFMKGLFAWVGFKTATIDYTRRKRVAGKTKFNGWRLWNFALEGMTSFSTSFLRIWTYLGISISLISFLFAMFIVLKILIYGVDVPGYGSLIVMVTFLGGLQLIGIGVIGEYLGRTYMESKNRPIFIIQDIYESDE